MSSEQLRRENKTDERKIHVEKDKVPKMTTHFESLTVKDTGDSVVSQHVIGTMGGNADGMHGQTERRKDNTEGITEGQKQKGSNVQNKGPSLEEIAKLRGTAQQNSMDTIKAAEERYQKAKEMGGSQTQNVSRQPNAGATQTVSEKAGRGIEHTGQGQQTSGQVKLGMTQTGYQTGRGIEHTRESQQTGGQMKHGVTQTGDKSSRTAAEKGARAKDYTVEKGQQTSENLSGATQTAGQKAARAKDYTVEKGQQTGQQAKEGLSSAAQTAAEKAARAKDYTIEKGQQTGRQARETLSSAAQTAAEKAARAKDYTVVKGQETSQQEKESLSAATQTAMEKAGMAKDYTLEKSVQAKDVVAEKTSGITNTAVDVSKKGANYVLETGKTTAGYVGKVAGVVKDKAVVAGWTATEFAGDKALGVTETMANVTAGVAGFAGDTAVATKNVVANVATKTKDMVVATEENVKEYAARKRTEKERELEAKNSKAEWEFDEGESVGDMASDFRNQMTENEGYGYEEHEGGFEKEGGGGAAAAGGVMRVIGETLVEIGQNTKDMLVGQGQGQGEYVGERQGLGENKRE